MKKQVFIFTLIIVFGCNPIGENENKTSGDDFDQATLAFKELKTALKKENGKLWNHKLEGPILLINRETREFISNQQDNKGEFIKKGNCFIGKFPENMNIANTAIDWNGKRWTMVVLPLSGKKEERLNLLIHESFHRIQPLIGLDSIHEIQSEHLDMKVGRIYLKLELEALKQALNSEKPEMHLKNAMLFRQYRYQLFPEAKLSENSLEINEGLAEYTGSILSGRTESEHKRNYSLKIDEFYNFPTFVRSFAYFTIPVYGFFMRKSDAAWNLKINKKTNLTDFITRFFQLNEMERDEEEIVQIGKTYNMDTIVRVEEERALKKNKQIAFYKAKFITDGVLTLGLENMNIGFNPKNLVPLDSFGTVYPNLRITDNWGVLVVDSCGALLSAEWNKVTISYPEFISDTLISGRGWKLKPNKHWKLEKRDTKLILIKR